MILHVNNAIKPVLRKRFEAMCLAGDFPKIEFQRTNFGTQYNLIEYSVTHSAFCKVVDDKVKETLRDELGIFSRKRSAEFIKRVEDIAFNVSAEQVRQSDRFKTMFD